MARSLPFLPVLLCVSAVGLTFASDGCECDLPTPCKAAFGCVVPLISDTSRCGDSQQDCRSSKENRRTLCSWNVKAEDGFCCWTACSSMRIKRQCGSAPAGFDFENTGVRDGRDCIHILNVREKCCLHEGHTMKAMKPQDHHCPKLGNDLAEIFDTVDGNRNSAPNKYISATEVLHSLKWLDSKGYMFLASNFSVIDIDGNHKVSWYELELFCGHTATRLPPEDLFKVKPTELTNCFTNPLLVACLLSSLVLGELYGIFQVFYKHMCRQQTQVDEGYALRIVYTLLCYVWPLTYNLFQVYYFFCKIEWEVCDRDEFLEFDGKKVKWDGEFVPFGVKQKYALVMALQSLLNANSFGQWVRRRKCPTRPSKDLERRIFCQQVYFRLQPRWVEFAFVTALGLAAMYSLNRAVFYGTISDMEVEGLDRCRREEPDLALLYGVNERFILWKFVQSSLISFYIMLGWGIDSKAEYTRLPDKEHHLLKPDQSKIEKVNELSDSERSTWDWFG